MTEQQNENIDNDQELFEHYEITVDKGQSLIRIDKFLMDRIENSSRSKIQDAAKDGNIWVNNKPVKANYKIKPDDHIRIMMPYPQREIEVIAEDIQLDIVYEDKDVIIINKPANMVVHPAYGNYKGTLLNAMKYHLEQNDPGSAPLMVHRIDKNTSGLLLMAKHEQAQTHLSRQFYNHTINRRYLGLVWGDLDNNEGTIEGNLGRSPANRKVMTVFPKGNTGKHAVTHYKVLERFGYVTAVECQLETGRTHQIRAHMKYLGHPLFNDETYGGNRIRKGTTFSKYKQFIENAFKLCPRQALHAKTLGFEHPVSGKWMEFTSDLPEDINKVMEKWRSYAHASIQSKQNPQNF
ncbi:MAG: RluA family pseudouridine synthase [Bacteroidales bacterium]|nr:RluA family pseudouridine synthase [Bacteroidales bacterium]MCF8328690.1 RluA family pseudouridine synthase [Bacteroidales bacterium]